MDEYMNINMKIIKNIEEKNRNYEILNNMKELMENNKIVEDINKTINEKDINNKFKNILYIYNEMSNKEENNKDSKGKNNLNIRNNNINNNIDNNKINNIINNNMDNNMGNNKDKNYEIIYKIDNKDKIRIFGKDATQKGDINSGNQKTNGRENEQEQENNYDEMIFEEKNAKYIYYPEKMLELINMIREDPVSYADIVEDSIQNIIEEENKNDENKPKIIYKKKVKVSLTRGEPAFREKG